MHVVVTCCGCMRQLRLPKEVIGGTVRCPLCKAIFLTRALDDDHAEAIPLGAKPSPPPPKPAPTKVPNMELEDAPPLRDDPDDLVLEVLPVEEEKRPGKRKKEAERFDIVGEVEEVREEEPRRERRPRRREEDEDEEEREDDDRPRKRRREAAQSSFSLFIQHDPNERLRGRFNAEIDPEGALLLWRGNGRVLEVPAGSGCEYLGQARLALPIDGRKVELTTVHPDGLNDELARAIAGFLDKQHDTFTMPVRPAGPVVWLSLLPLLIPFLAVIFGRSIGGVVGFLLWGVLAAVLAGGCYLITRQRNWSADGRAWGAVLTSLVGFLALAIGLRADSGGDTPSGNTGFGPWCALAPIDSGYRVEMPGRPARRASGFLALPPSLANEYCLDIPETGTGLVTAHGDRNPAAAEATLLQSIGRELATAGQNAGRVVNERELTVQGKKGREFLMDSTTRGKILVRVYVDGRRVFLTAFSSRNLPPTCEEATRFLDSFAFDPSTGWPTPGAGR